jgi:hypothetical protein
MRPNKKRKLTAGIASAAGAAVLALGSLTAGATAAPNPGPGSDGPQSANIPQVAWVGEHVRLVACDPSINNESVQFANYQVEDWSGYQFQAPTPDGDSASNLGQAFDPGPAAFFTSSEAAHSTDAGQDGCVATDYKSLNPGLARIRVDVRNEETGAVVFSHQYLVIWLTANTPKLAEAGLTENTNADGTPGDNTLQLQANPGALANFLGDPKGDGKFIPSPFDPTTATNQDKGLIQIKVTGSFPVVAESPLSNILPNSSYTLPADWATLAGTLASSSDETESPGSNPGLWDIHGTPSEATTTNAGSVSNDPLHDVFSRPAFGDDTSGTTATVGPFDPEVANETLLSDGRLNADDAPMPALRVDVNLAENTGGSDLGGVGQISGASKAQVYSHDLTGNDEESGNLYNPYYGAYIPATDRPGVNEVSGIDGPSPGGDFPGFLNNHSQPYTYWESVRNLNDRSSESTGCLRRAPGSATDATPEDDYQTPSGYTTETFYTDERGEAYVEYTPGDQFYLNHIPSIKTDANNGCDLEPVYNTVIGSSSITAKAVYPYEPVDYPPLTSGALVKTVESKWLKEVYEFPKGETPADQNVRILVAKAQDIDGYPFVGEEVCFNAEQNSDVEPFDGQVTDTTGQIDAAGSTIGLSGSIVRDQADIHSNHLCETTNSQGLAAIEVSNSSFSQVDLKTLFVNEGINRDKFIDFSTNPAGVKEAEEKKKSEEKATLEAKLHAEEEANRKAREALEEANKKTAEEKLAAETKVHTEQIETLKTAEEKLAAEKTARAEEEKAAKAAEETLAKEKKANKEAAEAEKAKNEEEIAKLAAARTAAVAAPSPLYAPAPAPATPVVGVKAVSAHKAAVKHKSKKKAKKAKKKVKKTKKK